MKRTLRLTRSPFISSFILYFVGFLSGIFVCVVLPLRRLAYLSLLASSSGFETDRNSSMVFIGGHPRSGTTLMRVLLDAHPSFHCGQETHIIPDLLTLRHKYTRERPKQRLKEASLDLELIDTTIADSIFSVIKKRGPPSKRLCTKDPFTLKHIPYLSLMFPNAKFILMVRDGRAVVHSIRANDIKIAHFPKTYSEALRRWSQSLEIMLDGCEYAGSERCIVIHYESLVLRPRYWLTRILRFLGAEWSESVLRHSSFVDKPGGIMLSRLEKSTHQVRRPIYKDALYSWVPSSVNISQKELISLAPILTVLGYVEVGQPPEYSKLKEKGL